jgi:hypothetical protein
MSDEPRIHLLELTPDKVRRYWSKLEPEIARACAYASGLYSPKTVFDKALAGEFQVWAAFTDNGLKAVGVTCLSKYPTGSLVAELLLVAGTDRRSWLLFDADLAAWAVAKGCDRLRCTGRKGWARSLPDSWRPTATIFEREIAPNLAEHAA